MISSKKLMKLAKKWQRLAAIKRKRISARRTADEGHFVVYTSDKKRYVLPIAYLNNYIVRELLMISEEEFGLPGNGPITLPCEALFMDYAISLMNRGTAEDIQKALIVSVANRCLLSHSINQQGTEPQLVVCGF